MISLVSGAFNNPTNRGNRKGEDELELLKSRSEIMYNSKWMSARFRLTTFVSLIELVQQTFYVFSVLI